MQFCSALSIKADSSACSEILQENSGYWTAAYLTCSMEKYHFSIYNIHNIIHFLVFDGGCHRHYDVFYKKAKICIALLTSIAIFHSIRTEQASQAL